MVRTCGSNIDIVVAVLSVWVAFVFGGEVLIILVIVVSRGYEQMLPPK